MSGPAFLNTVSLLPSVGLCRITYSQLQRLLITLAGGKGTFLILGGTRWTSTLRPSALIQARRRTMRGTLLFLMVNSWRRFRTNGKGTMLSQFQVTPLLCFVPLCFTGTGSPSKTLARHGTRRERRPDLQPRYLMTSGVPLLGIWCGPESMNAWQ